MNQQITLTVSDNVLFSAKAVATRNKRRIEEVLSEWLEKVSSEVEIEKLRQFSIFEKIRIAFRQQSAGAVLQRSRFSENKF